MPKTLFRRASTTIWVVVYFLGLQSWNQAAAALQAQTAERPVPVLQAGHSFTFYRGRVSSIALSPDDRFVVTGGGEGAIKVWERRSNLLIRTIPAHRGAVDTLTFSPDSKFFLSGGHDGEIKLWNSEDGRLERSYQGHDSSVNGVTFSPDGEMFASHRGGYTGDSNEPDTGIRLWETRTGRLLRILKGHASYVSRVYFSPSGDNLISGGDAIKIWSVATGREIKNIPVEKYVYLAGYSRDGRTLAAATYERMIFLNTQSGAEERSIPVKIYGEEIAFTPDWRYFATADREIKLWDAESGQLVRVENDEGDDTGLKPLAFSTNGSTLAIADGSSYKLWSTSRGAAVKSSGRQLGFTTGVAFSRDGRKIAWGSGELIHLWDVSNASLVRVLKGHTFRVNEVAFSPDGQTLASCSDAEVKLWSVGSGTPVRDLLIANDYDEWQSSQSVAFSPDGRLVAAGDHLSTLGIKIWDARSGRLLKRLKIPNPPGSAGIEGAFFLRPLGGPTPQVHSIAFSPDSRMIASGDGYNSVKLWDVRRGKMIRSLAGHTDFVNSVAFSPDGKKIVSGGFDNTVKVWETRTGRRVHNMALHRDWVASVKFSKDGKTIISSSYDHTIRLWDAATGAIKSTLEDHTGVVTSVAASPVDPIFVSASLDGKINFWSLSRNVLLSTLVALPDGGWLHFTPDGYYTSAKGGESFLAWREGGRIHPHSPEYQARFYNPSLVIGSLHGKTSAPTPAQPLPSVAAVPAPSPLPAPAQVVPQGQNLYGILKAKRYYALIIGNNDYQSLGDLTTAINDADEIDRVFKGEFGFDTKILRDATRNRIVSALSDLRRELSEDTYLIIYYAGHGVYDRAADRAYWLPVDATEDNTVNWISADEVTNNVRALTAKKVLIISDSCYSGMFERESRVRITPAERVRYLEKALFGQSRLLMTSGSNEPVSDIGGGRNHSIFAGALLRALKEIEYDTFTAEELFHSYIKEPLMGKSDQTPTYKPIRNSGHDSGDFIFLRRRR